MYAIFFLFPYIRITTYVVFFSRFAVVGGGSAFCVCFVCWFVVVVVGGVREGGYNFDIHHQLQTSQFLCICDLLS